MKKFLLISILSLSIFSCSNDDDIIIDPPISIDTPATYVFTRNNESTVSFSGQTTRILMSEELIDALKDFDSATEESLMNMFSNENNPFANADLNASSKNIKSKVAASQDYFSTNASVSTLIKADLDGFISSQVTEVFPAQNVAAAPGVAGQIADGSSTRFVNTKGFEYNQLFGKSLIGALMVDQALNNYLSTAVLDAATNVEDNDNDVLVDGQPYTTMEHKWDEAYGYLYGTSANKAVPNTTIGEDDNFLNKYIGRVENDDDFTGIAADIYDAFKLGRAAIVAKNYSVRDEQASLIREKISEVVGIRAVYYLQQGKNALTSTPVDYGAAFHDISEGYGFIYSLQFTRIPGTNTPYFSRAEVENFIAQLTSGNGLWEVTPETLDSIANEIASRFTFTVDQAED